MGAVLYLVCSCLADGLSIGAGTAYALQGCAHEYCYYCLATACPALVLDDPADVPVQHRRQRTFRCVVCNHVAHKAARSRR